MNEMSAVPKLLCFLDLFLVERFQYCAKRGFKPFLIKISFIIEKIANIQFLLSFSLSFVVLNDHTIVIVTQAKARLYKDWSLSIL